MTASVEVTAMVIASAAMVLLVLAVVLRPLWRDRRAAGAGAALTLALATGLIYTLVGTPRALDPAQRRAPDTLADAVVRLQAELARDPDQVEGWRLLANAHLSAGRTGEAQAALARALQLAPDDADLLTQAAEARALTAPGRTFDANAVAMLKRALAQQPMHQRARWFLGIAQRQAGQPADAAKTWEPLLASVDAGTSASLREQINAARGDAGLAPLVPMPQQDDAASRRITVSVSLDPALAMRLGDNAVVFVIARRPGGPPMPVAVEKLPAATLPQVVILDDADSLMPTAKLSQLQAIEITARVSASGDATPQKGDFQAVPATVLPGQNAAAVLIDRVVE